MATLAEHAYNIRNIARAGMGTSDDDRLNITQIEFWIKAYRAEGLSIVTDHGKDIDPQLVQDLGILTLERVDKADPLCPKVEWGCTVMKVPIPKFVGFPHNRAISFVGKIDKQTPINLDKADVHIYKRAAVFGSLISRAYYIGQNMYVVLSEQDEGMKYVNVRGVFEDPEKVTYSSPGCDPVCFDVATDNYPLPLNLYEFVVKRIFTKELNLTLQTAEDELNNARQDNTKLG